MDLIEQLKERADSQCELCQSKDGLSPFLVAPKTDLGIDTTALLCKTCFSQISQEEPINPSHWFCLKESMWNENDAVKVLSWRMLNRLKAEAWPIELLEMMYLDEDALSWARSTGEDLDESEKIIHRDSNGVQLFSGDSVTIIKDLNVKGGGFTAKRGTAVRNISLVHDNAEQVEGRVNGQQIVLLTQYIKKNS